MPSQTAKRPAPLERAGLRSTLERSAATKTVPAEYSRAESPDQAVAEAVAALRDAVAAVGVNLAELPLDVRIELAGLLGALVVERTARTITLQEAAFLADRSPQTIACWAVRHGIGRRIGGRWSVDAAKLDAYLAGGRP